MSEPRKEEAVELSGEDLGELAAQPRAFLDIRDRAYGFPARTYERCFVGSETVAAMVARGMAADADDALGIGNLLLGAGVLRHVLGEHPFRNEALFYRFAEDGGHGARARRPDGAAVSWADFVAPSIADGGAQNLQPELPPPDAMLASFAQDELDAIGVAPLDAHTSTLLDHVHPPRWVDPVPKPRYMLIVIGAGDGGLVSAAGAAGVGAQVALVESHLLGGDCLNVGCVPSKALLRCAHAAAAARNAAAYGVKVSGVEVDFATFSRHLADVDRSILEGEDEGFVKIHVQKGSDRILGATIVAPHAGDMIGQIAVAISAGMGLPRLASVIHPYPTVAEAIRQCGDAFNRGCLTPTVRKLFNRWMALQR